MKCRFCDEEHGDDLPPGCAAAYKAIKERQTCSFCNERGHDRDDCPHRRESNLPKICEHPKIDPVAVYVIGPETGRNLGYYVCDDCRRKLCRCERCSAFAGKNETILTQSVFCCAKPDVIEKFVGAWCRDGWRQARPWTLEEARGWLGIEGESTAAQAAAEAPEGWQEEGP